MIMIQYIQMRQLVYRLYLCPQESLFLTQTNLRIRTWIKIWMGLTYKKTNLMKSISRHKRIWMIPEFY